jgi:nitrate reductase gamma subunit
VWYIHAILTGAFIAYLPFSRLMHIIIAPVVLAINAASDH